MDRLSKRNGAGGLRRWMAPAAVAVLVAFAASGCGEDGTTDPPPPESPTISSIDKATVSPGDTVTISGDNFSDMTALNTVVFNNAYGTAKPFDSAATELRVVVPRHAASGAVTVRVTGAPEDAVGPELEVVRGVGDVWVFGATGEVNLPTPSAIVQYLLIPHSADTGVPASGVASYSIGVEDNVPVATSAVSRERRDTRTIREAFESHRWREAMRAIEMGARPIRQPRPDASRAPAAAAQTREFNVLNTTTGSTLDPGSYARVTAELRYDGQNCLIYTDVDTLPSGNVTQAIIDDWGVQFDNAIRPSNTKYFGTESDVDDNGKVIILVSPVINRLTPPNAGYFIGGFFLSIDLFAPGPAVPAGTTNEAEIFYMLAADPNGDYVSGNQFPVDFVAEENIKTIAHEYEHLISFSIRLFQFNGAFQRTWFEEGMAHMAEDLLTRESGDPKFNDSNIDRANIYLGDPGGVSLEDDNSNLDQRGGIYLFLRYIADRFGAEVLKDIVASSCSGRQCVESITGEDFYATMADFLATLYLSGRGINTSDRYNYSSIDLLADFDPVAVTDGVVGGPPRTGTVLRAGGDYLRITGAETGSTAFTFGWDKETSRLRTLVVRLR